MLNQGLSESILAKPEGSRQLDGTGQRVKPCIGLEHITINGLASQPLRATSIIGVVLANPLSLFVSDVHCKLMPTYPAHMTPAK